MTPRRSGGSVAAMLSGFVVLICVLSGVAAPAPALDFSLETLADVALHYSTIDEERLHAGGERILRRLDLSAREQADLVAFLETLTEREPLHELVEKPGSALCR